MEREQNKELLRENQALWSRLDGVLSIISNHSYTDEGFDAFTSGIVNILEQALEAQATALYTVEEFGFRAHGTSQGCKDLCLDAEFISTGSGILTQALRSRKTLQLQKVETEKDGSVVLVEAASQIRARVRSPFAFQFETIYCAPVFSYDRVVAIILVGWVQEHHNDYDDVRILETLAGYLSVELVAMVTQIEQTRSHKLSKARNEIIQTLQGRSNIDERAACDIIRASAQVVPLHALLLEAKAFDSNMNIIMFEENLEHEHLIECSYSAKEIIPEGKNIEELDEKHPFALWLGRHTDLSRGFAILLDDGDDTHPIRIFIAYRALGERPFDEKERNFFSALGLSVKEHLTQEREHASDAKIALALQAGLRNNLPDTKNMTCSSLYISATASAVVGGDFFDLYELDENHVVIVMGDVSGKGVEAAAMASLVKTAVAAYAWENLDPASMITSLNKLFLNFSRLETFASMVVVSFDLIHHQAIYCSAGHPPAMIIHKHGGSPSTLELLTVQSPIVGAFEDLEYHNGGFTFAKDDIVYLYTDGTTEARSREGDFFGEDLLRESLLKASSKDVKIIPQIILSEIQQFSGYDLHDDIAMVAARINV
ncbi:MAG: SpoIIE family protein phosphatase [Coriobacteriales bacterium]|nr:SpoIIE family protein phosphatase [Coriobacteriales bacterium]